MTLVTISHAVPIAMAYRLAPDYAHATGATQASIAPTADVLGAICLV